MFFVSVFSARETKAKINTRSYIKPKISGTAKETSWKQKCNQLNIRCLQIIQLIWVNIQNTFIQLKSKQTTWIKTGERTQTGIFPKKTPRREEAREKTLSITSRSANQSHNKMSPHICQNGYPQTEEKKALARLWRSLMRWVGGSVSRCCHYGKQYRGSSKKT